MQEIWKDIIGYEGLYQVSNLGNIKSFYKAKKSIKKPTLSNKGYLRVGLSKNKKSKTFKIHRLVAKTFLSNPNNYLEVNHKDGNKLNNCVDNLEWCSRSYNINHAWRNKLTKGRSKKLLQYDLNNNLIREFISAREASRTLHINVGDISSCCNHSHKHKTAGGYIWRYADK